MSGAIRNLHVWDRIILPSEENKTAQGNILSWQTAKLETNQEVSDFEFVNILTAYNVNDKNFTDVTLFCMNHEKEIAVASDKEMLKAMQNSSRYLIANQDAYAWTRLGGKDDYTFFSGHIRYSNKWIDYNTGQEMPLNEFEIEGEFQNVVCINVNIF